MLADVLQNPGSKKIGVNVCGYGTFGENTMNSMGPLQNNLHASVEISFMGADMCSRDITSNESAICPSSDFMREYSALQYDRGMDDHFDVGYDSQILTTNDGLKNNVKDEEGEFPTESVCSTTKMKMNGHMGRPGNSETGVSMSNYLDVEGWNYGYEVNDYVSSIGCSLFDANGCPIDEKVPVQPLASAQSFMCGEEGVKGEKPTDMLAPTRFNCNSVDIFDEAVSREHSFFVDNKMFSKESKSSFSISSCSFSTQKTEQLMDLKEDMIVPSNKLYHPQNDLNISLASPQNTGNLSLNAQGQYMPFAQPFTSSNSQPTSVGSHFSKVSPESSHSNFSEKSVVEDDSDICIIEDISHPAPIPTLTPSNRSLAFKNTIVTSHHSTSSDNHVGVGGRFKAKDERVILRLLQVCYVTLEFFFSFCLQS